MAHIITSPVKRFPGTVELPDYLNYPQYRAWQAAVVAARDARDRNRPADPAADATWEYDADEYRHAFLAGVCAVVAVWHLTGLPDAPTPDTFPVRPANASADLFDWLVREITLAASDVDGDDPK